MERSMAHHQQVGKWDSPGGELAILTIQAMPVTTITMFRHSRYIWQSSNRWLRLCMFHWSSDIADHVPSFTFRLNEPSARVAPD